MHRHPFARAMSPAIGEYTRNTEASKHRLLGAYPAAGRVPQTSQPPRPKPEVGIWEVQCEHFQRRPPYKMAIQDAGFALILNGQEEHAKVPEYGRGAVVDGTITFANPGSITRVEVKIEGHVTIEDAGGGNGSLNAAVLSELLVFWDAPNRLGGYSSGHASGDFAPQPGSCPRSFSFKATLPIHYTDTDGSTCALPPTFSETLPEMPGFHCDVRYEITICLTRVRDMRVKALRAQWKRGMVYRVPVEYRPRTRPSQPAPFPTNSNGDKGSITRFTSTLESVSPFVEPIKITLYLPNSQITPLSSPIPFFLRVSGPEPTIKAFSRPPLSSFLPKTEPDSFPTICSMIGHVVNENLQNTRLARVLSLPGTRSDSWSALEGEKELERRHHAQTARRGWARGAAPSTGVRVALVRVVTVHSTESHTSTRQNAHSSHPESKNNEFDTSFAPGTDPDSKSVLNSDGSGGRTRSHMFKRTVLGEGVMYTASVSRGSVTWAGEIRVDPKLGLRTGGFNTGSLNVRDMLIVSVREPYPDLSTGIHREFQQVITVRLTTDPFKED